MIELELDCDFVLLERVIVSGILPCEKIFEKKFKNEDENEEEKNQLLVGLCYKFLINTHFHMSESSILEDHNCDRI